jgi:multidrug efflux pump
MVLKPWDQRKLNSNALQPLIQQEMNTIAGSRVAVIQLPSLPGSRGLPIQFAINSTESVTQMLAVSEQFIQAAQKTGMFMFLDSDLKVDQPQSRVIIDRNKTALLGLTMQDVGASLSAMLGGNYVNYFSPAGRSYKVIPQVQQQSRLNAEQLLAYQLRTATGESVALSTIASLSHETVPQSLNHFQQLNSALITGVPLPDVALGDALNSLKALAEKTLPMGYSLDYSGQSRQLMQESNAFIATFLFALVIIFLALAAQFESFRDPLIILVSVPMSITGALIFVALGIGNATLNIYTEVGFVTLMGLISKHGILIVEFANKSQREGRSKREAIEEAASTRLRPILMTTAAMVLGVLPLIFATGAGAAARFSMGLVIATGLSIGTLFTLFVVPAVYLILGQNHAKLVVENEI